MKVLTADAGPASRVTPSPGCIDDLTDCTNANLSMTNVQPWDAADYLVALANASASTTSRVAHLYVMSPGLLTNWAVIDNYDDNKLTG